MPVSSSPRPDLQRLIDFVNTRELSSSSEALPTPAGLARWLGVDRAGDRDLASAHTLREALRAVLVDADDAAAWATIDRHAQPLRIRFSAGGGVALTPSSSEDSGHDSGDERGDESPDAAAALTALLAPVVWATADGSWARVKACAAGDCHWAFYDRSRNRSGRWCEMAECGNRAKVRAHRARRNETTS